MARCGSDWEREITVGGDSRHVSQERAPKFGGSVTIKIIAVWFTILAVCLTFRCWQGGMFDTGLERLFGWTPAQTDDNWLLDELNRDCRGR